MDGYGLEQRSRSNQSETSGAGTGTKSWIDTVCGICPMPGSSLPRSKSKNVETEENVGSSDSPLGREARMDKALVDEEVSVAKDESRDDGTEASDVPTDEDLETNSRDVPFGDSDLNLEGEQSKTGIMTKTQTKEILIMEKSLAWWGLALFQVFLIVAILAAVLVVIFDW